MPVKKTASVKEAEVEKKESTTVSKAEAENEELKKQIEALQAQMAMMANMIAASKNATEDKPVRNDRYITFVNMTTGSVVLKGNSVYEIEGQFNSRKFLEKEAKIIVNNMKNTIDSGYVYIADADFVKDCELEDTYATLLSDKVLKDLLNHDASYVVETYKNVSDGQKQIIVDMLERKKSLGEYVDANVLMQIGELAHRDLINIEPEE